MQVHLHAGHPHSGWTKRASYRGCRGRHRAGAPPVAAVLLRVVLPEASSCFDMSQLCALCAGAAVSSSVSRGVGARGSDRGRGRGREPRACRGRRPRCCGLSSRDGGPARLARRRVRSTGRRGAATSAAARARSGRSPHGRPGSSPTACRAPADGRSTRRWTFRARPTRTTPDRATCRRRPADRGTELRRGWGSHSQGWK